MPMPLTRPVCIPRTNPEGNYSGPMKQYVIKMLGASRISDVFAVYEDPHVSTLGPIFMDIDECDPGKYYVYVMPQIGGMELLPGPRARRMFQAYMNKPDELYAALRQHTGIIVPLVASATANIQFTVLASPAFSCPSEEVFRARAAAPPQFITREFTPTLLYRTASRVGKSSTMSLDLYPIGSIKAEIISAMNGKTYSPAFALQLDGHIIDAIEHTLHGRSGSRPKYTHCIRMSSPNIIDLESCSSDLSTASICCLTCASLATFVAPSDHAALAKILVVIETPWNERMPTKTAGMVPPTGSGALNARLRELSDTKNVAAELDDLPDAEMASILLNAGFVPVMPTEHYGGYIGYDGANFTRSLLFVSTADIVVSTTSVLKNKGKINMNLDAFKTFFNPPQ